MESKKLKRLGALILGWALIFNLISNINIINAYSATSTRISGSNKIQTSIAVADKFRNGAKLKGVILAYAENFPDALSGGVLIKKYNSPILLINKTVASSKETLNYINKNVNKSGQVIILGSNGVINDSIVKDLKNKGFEKVKRLGGSDRFATNVAIVKDFNPAVGSSVIVSYSHNFPDALSAAPVSAVKGMPIFLVRDKVTAEQKKLLSKIKPKNIYITGSSGVVSSSIEKELKKYSSKVVRLGGSTRYETSNAINNRFKSDLSGPNAIIASGSTFADALVGTALAYKLKAPMILVNTSNNKLQKTYISKNNKSKVYVIGSKSVVSDSVVKEVTSSSSSNTSTKCRDDVAKKVIEMLSTANTNNTDVSDQAVIMTPEHFAFLNSVSNDWVKGKISASNAKSKMENAKFDLLGVGKKSLTNSVVARFEVKGVDAKTIKSKIRNDYWAASNYIFCKVYYNESKDVSTVYIVNGAVTFQ